MSELQKYIWAISICLLVVTYMIVNIVNKVRKQRLLRSCKSSEEDIKKDIDTYIDEFSTNTEDYEVQKSSKHQGLVENNTEDIKKIEHKVIFDVDSNLLLIKGKYTDEYINSTVKPIYQYIFEANYLVPCRDLLKFFPDEYARIKCYGLLTNNRKTGILDILEEHDLVQRIDDRWTKGSYGQNL